MDEPKRARPLWHYIIVAAAVVLAMAAAEVAMGRVVFSKTGRLMLWTPQVASAENSGTGGVAVVVGPIGPFHDHWEAIAVGQRLSARRGIH